VNKPGSYEAFLELFAPEDYFRLVIHPDDRRRARGAVLAVLVAVAVAACGWGVAASVLATSHASAARIHHHRHHRHAVHSVIHHELGRDAALGELV
jgi:hypothetical protein